MKHPLDEIKIVEVICLVFLLPIVWVFTIGIDKIKVMKKGLLSFIGCFCVLSLLVNGIDLANPNSVGLTVDDSTILQDPNIFVLVIGAAAATDSCTYGGSGDWNVDFADNCLITSNVDVGGNDIKITGFGNFTTYANITGYKNLNRIGNSSGTSYVNSLRGGGFK